MEESRFRFSLDVEKFTPVQLRSDVFQRAKVHAVAAALYEIFSDDEGMIDHNVVQDLSDVITNLKYLVDEKGHLASYMVEAVIIDARPDLASDDGRVYIWDRHWGRRVWITNFSGEVLYDAFLTFLNHIVKVALPKILKDFTLKEWGFFLVNLVKNMFGK